MPERVFLFFRRSATRAAAQRRMSMGFPAANDDATFNDAAQGRIIDTVNTVTPTTVLAVLPTIRPLMVPNIVGYDADGDFTGVTVLFLWSRLRRPDRELFSAYYGVPFFISAPAPSTPAHLAYVLVRFAANAKCDHHEREEDDSIPPPRLVRLSYVIYHGGVLGIMLYNRGMRAMYRDALQDAADYPDDNYSAEFDVPLSTWPPDNLTLRTNNAIRSCILAARMFIDL
ncbi:hypothetical protein B0H21DRAFT_827640 [Amylocystis lapponica]|nr:hypothetical protein B0H21DRAFT_827640 [Amylocystis lapponica]